MNLPTKQGIYKILFRGDWEIAEWDIQSGAFWQNDGDIELWLQYVTNIQETNGEFTIADCKPSEAYIKRENSYKS